MVNERNGLETLMSMNVNAKRTVTVIFGNVQGTLTVKESLIVKERYRLRNGEGKRNGNGKGTLIVKER